MKDDLFHSIGLKITGDCNLSCPFCCEPKRTQPVFPLENFKKIIDVVSEYGTRRLCLTGGDPLKYPNLRGLVEHAHERGLDILLLTSDGQLLLKKLPDIYEFINSIRISVHGWEQDHDDIVRKKGAFKEVKQAIVEINRCNIPLFITTVVTRSNIETVDQIAEWCVANRVRKYFLFGLMQSGLGYEYAIRNGMVIPSCIKRKAENLSLKYKGSNIEFISYEYINPAECILIYGDGRLVIDPYFESDTYQYEIGNVFKDSRKQILDSFSSDPRNVEGHLKHVKMYGSGV